MDDEPPRIRCPACGSTMTTPLHAHLWECRYHLCRVIFPTGRMREKAQMMLVSEEDALYCPDDGKE